MTMSVEKCFECNTGTLTPSLVSITGSRNGEEYRVTVPGLICDSCGYTTIDNRESGEFTKAVSDAYKQAHGLLTGAELRKRRSEWLKMSQQDFADYLGVGQASVKRWESGQIQERAMDELIRLKTDPEAARNNLHTLQIQVPERYAVSCLKPSDRRIDLQLPRGQNLAGQPSIGVGQFYMAVLDDVQFRTLQASSSRNLNVVGNRSQPDNDSALIDDSLGLVGGSAQNEQVAAIRARPHNEAMGAGWMTQPPMH